jgi:hypothetical protein
LSNIFLPKEEKFFTLFSFGQHRTIAQERFARQFFARERRKAAGILTDFKVLQRIPDEKFPQSAAVVIVRWCPCAEPFFSVSVRNSSFQRNVPGRQSRRVRCGRLQVPLSEKAIGLFRKTQRKTLPPSGSLLPGFMA